MEHKMLSLADQVFDALEKAILSGEFERDEILTEVKLSEKMGVSRTPIREALMRLSQERIIEMTGKGARVIGILPEDIQDIYEIRLRIEGLCVRKASQNMTEEGLQELKSALELQEFYTLKGDPDGIKNMDSRFHQTLYRLCGSAALRDTLEPLHKRIVKYRKASIATPDRAQRSLEEHRAIYDAIAARDADKAEALTLSHIQQACNHILNGKKD